MAESQRRFNVWRLECGGETRLIAPGVNEREVLVVRTHCLELHSLDSGANDSLVDSLPMPGSSVTAATSPSLGVILCLVGSPARVIVLAQRQPRAVPSIVSHLDLPTGFLWQCTSTSVSQLFTCSSYASALAWALDEQTVCFKRLCIPIASLPGPPQYGPCVKHALLSQPLCATGLPGYAPRASIHAVAFLSPDTALVVYMQETVSLLRVVHIDWSACTTSEIANIVAHYFKEEDFIDCDATIFTPESFALPLGNSCAIVLHLRGAICVDADGAVLSRFKHDQMRPRCATLSFDGCSVSFFNSSDGCIWTLGLAEEGEEIQLQNTYRTSLNAGPIQVCYRAITYTWSTRAK